jgi:hypothetical protein
MKEKERGWRERERERERERGADKVTFAWSMNQRNKVVSA